MTPALASLLARRRSAAPQIRARYLAPALASLLARRRAAANAPPSAITLVDAAVNAVRLAMVPGQICWFGVGQAPPVLPGGATLTLPYAALGEPDEDNTNSSTSGDRLAEGQLVASVYAASKTDAIALGKAIAAALNDAPLTFQDGLLVYLRQAGRSASQDPDPGPDQEDVFVEIRLFQYRASSNLSQG